MLEYNFMSECERLDLLCAHKNNFGNYLNNDFCKCLIDS